MITEANEPGTTGYNSQDYNGGTAWPAGAWALDSFYYDYSGTPGVMTLDANASWTRSDHLPSLSQQDTYENDNSSGTPLQERSEAYQAVLGGLTLGVFLGNDIMWGFGYDYQYSTGYIGPIQWKTWFTTPATTARINLAQLMRSREFWKMVPDTGQTVVTVGYGSGDTITTTARSSDGQAIIAYIPNGNATTLTVEMSQITSATSTAICWWFNPSTGSTTLIGTYTTSGTQYFTPPDSNDWVLVIDDANANLAAQEVLFCEVDSSQCTPCGGAGARVECGGAAGVAPTRVAAGSGQAARISVGDSERGVAEKSGRAGGSVHAEQLDGAEPLLRGWRSGDRQQPY